jgi:hypothetical protein
MTVLNPGNYFWKDCDFNWALSLNFVLLSFYCEITVNIKVIFVFSFVVLYNRLLIREINIPSIEIITSLLLKVKFVLLLYVLYKLQ